MTTLRRSTKVLGGNLLVITDLGDLVTRQVATGREVGRLHMMSGSGYALRALPGAPPVKPGLTAWR